MLALESQGCLLQYGFGVNSMTIYLSPSTYELACFPIPPWQLWFIPLGFTFCSPYTLLFLASKYHCFCF